MEPSFKFSLNLQHLEFDLGSSFTLIINCLKQNSPQLKHLKKAIQCTLVSIFVLHVLNMLQVLRD